MHARSVLLTILVFAIVLGALAGIVAVMEPGSLPEEAIVTVVLAGAYTLGAFIAVVSARRMRRTRNACLTLIAIGFATSIGGVWAGRFGAWDLIEWCYALASVAVIAALALEHRMILAPLGVRSSIGRVAKRVALIAAPVTAGWMDLTLLLYVTTSVSGEGVLQIGAVGLVIAAASSAIAGLVRAFESKPDEDDPGVLSPGVAVRLTCPRCETPMSVRSNTRCACESCGLRVLIEVEEPRCACGYLLYQLESDICPECGRPVATAAWKRPKPAEQPDDEAREPDGSAG